MATEDRKLHFKAVRMLMAATIFWCISFPVVKALMTLQSQLLPESHSWFQASLVGLLRFGSATMVLLLLTAPSLRRLTWLEVWQGVGLGFFAGGGILLQTDGLARTTASVSAFLTQTFCVWVIAIVAVRDRRPPPPRIFVATAVVILGVAILNDLRMGHLSLGWGEWETLMGAVFFAGQIVWLERPVFSRNNPSHFSLVMFATMALISLPLLVTTWATPGDVLVVVRNPAVMVLIGTLVLFSTLAAFVLMNKWQPFVPATEAAIIYGAEPVLASSLALFLPGIISRFAGIDYENELLSWDLVAGGGLIVLANVYLQANWVSAPASQKTGADQQ